jgi:hypothetical protein
VKVNDEIRRIHIRIH